MYIYIYIHIKLYNLHHIGPKIWTAGKYSTRFLPDMLRDKISDSLLTQSRRGEPAVQIPTVTLIRDHRATRAGRDLRGSPAQSAAQSKGSSQVSRLLRVLFNLVQKISKDTDYTTVLGNLFHCFTVLMVKKVFLMSSNMWYL